MKKRLLKCLCACLLLPVLLAGCWQEPPVSEDSGPLQPGEEPEPAESRVILPEHFSLPYAPDRSLDPVACPDGMQQVVASLICEACSGWGRILSRSPGCAPAMPTIPRSPPIPLSSAPASPSPTAHR